MAELPGPAPMDIDLPNRPNRPQRNISVRSKSFGPRRMRRQQSRGRKGPGKSRRWKLPILPEQRIFCRGCRCHLLPESYFTHKARFFRNGVWVAHTGPQGSNGDIGTGVKEGQQCVDFLQGSCSAGKDCPFMHGTLAYDLCDICGEPDDGERCIAALKSAENRKDNMLSIFEVPRFCLRCGMDNHMVEDCEMPIGYFKGTQCRCVQCGREGHLMCGVGDGESASAHNLDEFCGNCGDRGHSFRTCLEQRFDEGFSEFKRKEINIEIQGPAGDRQRCAQCGNLDHTEEKCSEENFYANRYSFQMSYQERLRHFQKSVEDSTAPPNRLRRRSTSPLRRGRQRRRDNGEPNQDPGPQPLPRSQSHLNL
eukprot:596179_1